MGTIDKAFKLVQRDGEDKEAERPMMLNIDGGDQCQAGPSHPRWGERPRTTRRLRRRFLLLLASSICVLALLAWLFVPKTPSSRSWWGATGRHAIVTSLYNDGYLNGTLALGHSIDRHTSRPLDKVVLTIPGRLSANFICQLEAAGWKLWEAELIPPPPKAKDKIYSHFRDQFTKLRVWQMEQYDHLLYVDSDCLVTGELDSIFDLPIDFAAVPDVYEGVELRVGFNAGVLYLRPNATLFDRFMRLIDELDYTEAWAEQGFLNEFYKYTAHRLPYAWNANLATKWWPREWAALLREARIVHFTLSKPMVPGKALDRFKEENALWTTAWKGFVAERPDVFERCRVP